MTASTTHSKPSRIRWRRRRADLSESPTQLTRPAWGYVLRRTVKEFSRDQCTDEAAGLTYYGVLALFPGIIALLSLVGLVGQSDATVDTITGILEDLGAGTVVDTLRPTLESLSEASGAAGVALAFGLATSLWSASGYVGSFSRAMNRVYEVKEGRPFWKLRPQMLLVTAVVVLLAATVLVSLVLTGPAAEAVGNVIGLGSTAVLVWDLAKWPFVLGMVILVVALLYWATPNVSQPKFRWVSPGAAVAVGVWILASAGFGFYVANFGSYNKTYGTLAGAVVFLLWMWLTNIALLFGAELDAEMERARELQAGLPAEDALQLPPRDTRNIEKAHDQRQELLERARMLRVTQGQETEPVEQRPADPSRAGQEVPQ